MGFGGGLVGGIIGACFGGPWGALIGAGVGAAITGNGKKNQDNTTRTASDQTGFQTQEELVLAAECKLFECLGRLAKSDGHVSENEAALVSEVLKSIEQPARGKTKLKQAFAAGKDSNVPFSRLVTDLAEFYPGRDTRETFLNLFCSLAIADRDLSPVEHSMLLDAERILQLPGFVRKFFAEYQSDGTGGQQSESRQAPRQENSLSLEEAYAKLGCAKTVSNPELKKAWRTKILEFHPDKIQGKGLNAAFIEFAKSETQKLNLAYETICRARGIEAK